MHSMTYGDFEIGALPQTRPRLVWRFLGIFGGLFLASFLATLIKVRHETGLFEAIVFDRHVNAVLHLLAGPEGCDEFLRDVYLVTGLGISSFACRTFLDFEHPKITQLNSSLVD